MNTQLLLIRHGDVIYVDSEGRERPELIYNGDTAQLTELGKSQLKSLGRTLRSEGIVPNVIISSDFRRAIDSAEALQKGLGQANKLSRNRALRDVAAPNWDGISKEEFIHLTRGDIYTFQHNHPDDPYVQDQETLEKLINRQRGVQRLLQSWMIVDGFISEGITNYAFVGHGDQMSALHWAMTHEPTDFPSSYWDMQESFKLEKAEAYLFDINLELRIVGEGRRIRIPEVDQSVEGWRNQGKERG